MKKTVLRACAVSLALAVNVGPGSTAGGFPAEWRQPTEPFRIVGNIYYVGTKGLAAYLLTSGRRAILLDGTLPENAPLIERSIETLGFRLGDVKIILVSHAHVDHAGAVAELKRASGAALYASSGDRWALEHGRHDDDSTHSGYTFPGAAVDHVLEDGETVTLGDVSLTATLTPGHTKGCTTWSVPVVEGGRTLRVVFPCSLSVAGNVLLRNEQYPGIAGDYERSFAAVAGMQADIVLPAHPDQADVLGREARRKAGDGDAFVEPGLLRRIVDKSRTGYERELSRQRARK